jgi:ketosteroid isomerase-like protein
MTAGWEAFKAKDAKAMTDMTTADLSFVDPIGTWIAGRDAVVKHWTTLDCTGITKTSVKNGFASALSPTVEIWTGTGNADGTCSGQKNGDLHQTALRQIAALSADRIAQLAAFLNETRPRRNKSCNDWRRRWLLNQWRCSQLTQLLPYQLS